MQVALRRMQRIIVRRAWLAYDVKVSDLDGDLVEGLGGLGRGGGAPGLQLFLLGLQCGRSFAFLRRGRHASYSITHPSQPLRLKAHQGGRNLTSQTHAHCSARIHHTFTTIPTLACTLACWSGALPLPTSSPASPAPWPPSPGASARRDTRRSLPGGGARHSAL